MATALLAIDNASWLVPWTCARILKSSVAERRQVLMC
jgi:hypothetical protein